ncbi:MAG: Cupin domain [Thermomicrobiales bacterium]|nr:Cupin domain [Thermomicrobiales bacterium]
MNTPRIDTPVSSPTDGLSRRIVVGASASGLALALLARSFSQTNAQDATPAAEGGEPDDIVVVASSTVPVPVADVPAEGFSVGITRLTLEPGGSSPASSVPHAAIDHVETGTLICPGGAPRFLFATDGSMQEVGDGDITVSVGESLYIPPNVPDGARNEGTDLLTVLRIELIPLEGGMATPSA